MKKFVISLTVITGLFLIIFNHFNKVFASEHHFVNTTESFKKLADESDIDIMFYGSSHSYRAYNPLVIDKICKTNSFNIGSDGLRMSLTDLVLEETLKYTTPKLIVLEVYQGSLSLPETETAKGYQLRALDFIPNYSLEKYKKTKKLYNQSEYLSVLFPLIRNHQKWNNRKYFDYDRKEKLDPKRDFFYSGFIGSLKIMKDKKAIKKYKEFKKVKRKRDPSKDLLNDTKKQDLINFIEIARKNNIDVLIVSSPDLRASFNNYTFFDDLKLFCENQNVTFLNFNNYYNQLKLELDDFRDEGHLNIYGSIKLSKYLAFYIKRNYQFKDRSSENQWKKGDSIYNNDSVFQYSLKRATSK